MLFGGGHHLRWTLKSCWLCLSDSDSDVVQLWTGLGKQMCKYGVGMKIVYITWQLISSNMQSPWSQSAANSLVSFSKAYIYINDIIACFSLLVAVVPVQPTTIVAMPKDAVSL